MVYLKTKYPYMKIIHVSALHWLTYLQDGQNWKSVVLYTESYVVLKQMFLNIKLETCRRKNVKYLWLETPWSGSLHLDQVQIQCFLMYMESWIVKKSLSGAGNLFKTTIALSWHWYSPADRTASPRHILGPHSGATRWTLSLAAGSGTNWTWTWTDCLWHFQIWWLCCLRSNC